MMGAGLVGLILRQQVLYAAAPAVIVLQACGVALMVWARLTFGVRSFHATASPTQGGLVTTGPYRWFRHPIYTSVCLFVWACVVGHPSWFSVGMASLVTSGAMVRMLAEESRTATAIPRVQQTTLARQVGWCPTCSEPLRCRSTAASNQGMKLTRPERISRPSHSGRSIETGR